MQCPRNIIYTNQTTPSHRRRIINNIALGMSSQEEARCQIYFIKRSRNNKSNSNAHCYFYHKGFFLLFSFFYVKSQMKYHYYISHLRSSPFRLSKENYYYHHHCYCSAPISVSFYVALLVKFVGEIYFYFLEQVQRKEERKSKASSHFLKNRHRENFFGLFEKHKRVNISHIMIMIVICFIVCVYFSVNFHP